MPSEGSPSCATARQQLQTGDKVNLDATGASGFRAAFDAIEARVAPATSNYRRREHLEDNAACRRKTACRLVWCRRRALSNSTALGRMCLLATACRHVAGHIAQSYSWCRSPEGRPHLSQVTSVGRILAKQGRGGAASDSVLSFRHHLRGLAGPRVRLPSPPPGRGVFRGPQQAQGQAQGGAQAQDIVAAGEGPREEVPAGAGFVAGGVGRQGPRGRARSVGCHAGPGRARRPLRNIPVAPTSHDLRGVRPCDAEWGNPPAG
jgi:hypothetical protein